MNERGPKLVAPPLICGAAHLQDCAYCTQSRSPGNRPIGGSALHSTIINIIFTIGDMAEYVKSRSNELGFETIAANLKI